MKTALLALALLLPASFSAFSGDTREAKANDPSGLWKTFDDKTRQARGLVRVYEKDGLFYGRIVRSLDPTEASEVCGKCSGERHNQPISGLLILRDMKRKGGEYSGGEILDPETGSVYRCRMTLEEGGAALMVRGYIGLPIAGRTQRWVRAD